VGERHAELLRQVADLTAERDALRRQADVVKADIRTVIGQRGHAHTVHAVWDDANPSEYAGKPCAECQAWDRLGQLITTSACTATPHPGKG
jgi:hypothetical protein